MQQEIRTHPGSIVFYRWDALRRVDHMVQLNESELRELLEMPRQDRQLAIELFQNTRNPFIRDAFNVDLLRRLHNYLSTAKTLVDHTRALVTKEKDTAFLAEYEVRKKRVAAAPVTAFIHGFRNYLLHQRLPPFVGVVKPIGRLGQRGFEYEVVLEAALLTEQGEDWSAGAKAYMKSKENRCNLLEPMTEYAALIGELQTWLFDQFERLHGSEVEAAQLLRDEYSAFFRGEDDGLEGFPAIRETGA